MSPVYCSAYVSIVARVTLIRTEEKLQQCWKAIKCHIDRCVVTQDCDELPLNIWNQTTIYNYLQILYLTVSPSVIRFNKSKVDIAWREQQCSKSSTEILSNNK
jgi:hypothetical protein